MSEQHVRGASLVCDEGRHSVCDHTCGVGYALLPRRLGGGPYQSLCKCECHNRCPLAGRDLVPPDLWQDQCTCPGANEPREFRAARRAEFEERRGKMRAAMSEVEFGHGRSKEELKADIDAAFRRQETEQSDSMVDVLAELAWAGTGPRPLVVPRLARLGGRLAIRGLHFLRDLSEDVDDEDDGKDEKGPSA